MAIYARKDSKYWYYWIPGFQGRGAIRERTLFLIEGPTPEQTAENRRAAEELYAIRLREVARQRGCVKKDQPKNERAGKNDGWVYLYFVHDGRNIKIGRALNVLNRLRALQVSHAERLELLAAIPVHGSVERLVHRQFRHLRGAGEWFRPDVELLAFIEAAKRGEPLVALLRPEFQGPGGRPALNPGYVVQNIRNIAHK